MSTTASVSSLLMLNKTSRMMDKIKRLVDPGSMFIPVAMNMTRSQGDDFRLYSGIARICGVDVMLIAINDKISGGIFTEALVAQMLRALQVAHLQRLGTVFIVSSGGADLCNQANLFIDTGRIYYQLAKMREERIPTLAIVTGTATAGAAYIPGMCQSVIAVKDAAQMYLAGPVLVKAAIGQTEDPEQLGGARMHAEKTGLVDYLANDFDDAALRAEGLIRAWPHAPNVSHAHAQSRPMNPSQWLVNEQLDMEAFLNDLSDGPVEPYQEAIAPEMVCQMLVLSGSQVAVLSTTGPITSRGARKASSFIKMIDGMGAPIIFIQNTVGFMVGVQEEQAGIICAGSELIHAISVLKSPKITLHVGPAYGAGYYAMCGKPYAPDFIISWPSYHLAVMGADNAAKVMLAIKSRKHALSESEKQNLYQGIFQQYQRESRSDFCSQKGFDDCMIDPQDTKAVILRVLEIIDKRHANTHP